MYHESFQTMLKKNKGKRVRKQKEKYQQRKGYKPKDDEIKWKN